MKTIDFPYFIERYNANEMDEAEKKWFEKELQGNEDLRKEVLLRKRTDKILQKHDIISLRSKLTAIERTKIKSPSESSGKKSINIRYAAAIAGLILISSLIINQGRHQSKEAIFSKYYKTYEVLAASRSSESVSVSAFNKAKEFYNNKEFQRAAMLFKQVLSNDPGDMQSEFLYGVSNMEMKSYPEAKISFNKVIVNYNNLFREDAQWYLAWCYIKTDEHAEAIKQLQIIKESGSIYNNDAKKLLKQLK
jgi:tetratricopeptide (TPR) repeat protein